MAPSAICNPATLVSSSAATLNGTAAEIPAGGSARFRRSVVSGGPYANAVAALPGTDGPVSAAIAALVAETQYFYILEILDENSQIVATSGECSLTTLAAPVVVPAAGTGCPPPPGASDCPAIATYSVGGTEYISFIFCDGNNQVFAVYQLCSGVISGAPSYYDLSGNAYTPVGTPIPCPAGGFDFEQTVFCDAGNNDHLFISRIRFDDNGDLVPDQSGLFEIDQVTPYTLVGPAMVCGTGNQVTVEQACIRDSLTDQVIDPVEIVKLISPSTGEIIQVRIFTLDGTTEYTLPLPATQYLGRCVETLPQDCVPSSNVSLNRLDCTGGPVPATVLATLSPLSVNIDDPDLDGVCDGAVSIPPETFPAPFPVTEPVRTAASGLTLFNDAKLTASPAGGNLDVPGAGWLRLTNNVNSQRGGAIMSTPFPSTTGIEFEYTYAVYGKTGALGADGHSFMLLDGNQPLPTQMGAAGGALGYANTGPTPGILGGVIGIGLDEFGNFSNPGAGVTNTGPGFRPQHLVIRGAGNGGLNEYPWLTGIDLQALTGQTIDGHPRNAPVKVRGSLIPNAGQMTLNLFLDFGMGYVQVVSNLVINQVLPTQLRIGFSSSTGGYNNAHEIRDIVVAPPSRRHWRTITPEFDVPPACATALEGLVTVDYTLTSDTQNASGGDNDDDHFVGWALEDPVGTYTWLSQKWIRSAPIDVGPTRTLTLATGTLTTAQKDQLRLVIGAETVDLRGSYGTRFNTIKTELIATGCPTEIIKTVPISAPCPIPVYIAQSADGGAAITPTVNTADTQLVCSDIGTLIRREINDTSGIPKVTFLSLNGIEASPASWTPGPCPDCGCTKIPMIACLLDTATGIRQTVTIVYSVTNGGLFDPNGTVVLDASGNVITLIATHELTLGDCPICTVAETCYFASGVGSICEGELDRVLWNNSLNWDSGNPSESTIETALSNGNTPVTVENTQLLGIQTILQSTGAGIVGIEYGVGAESFQMTISPGGTGALQYSFDRTVCIRVSTRVDRPLSLTITGDGPIHAYHSTSDPATQGPVPVITGDNTTSVLVTSPTPGQGSRILFEMQGTTFTVSLTNSSGNEQYTFFGLYLGLPTGSGSATYRVFTQSDGSQTIINVDDDTDRPAAIDPSWTLIPCADKWVDVESTVLCDGNGTTFLRWYIYDENGILLRTRDTDLIGVTFVPLGNVQSCEQTTSAMLPLCDETVGGLIPFLRKICLTCSSTASTQDYELDGTTPYVVQGIVKTCTGQSDSGSVAEFVLCDDNGAFLRWYKYDADGTLISVSETDLAGTAYTPVGTVKGCSSSSPTPCATCRG
jgi:hypothetical protein